MSAVHIGDPEHVHASGGKITLRLFDQEGLFAVIHNDHIENVCVEMTVTGASVFELTLKHTLESSFGKIKDTSILEMYSWEPEVTHSARVLAGTIDFMESKSDRSEGGERLVVLQGRSQWAGLIDSPIRRTIRGRIEQVVTEVAAGEAATVPRAFFQGQVDTSMNCPSAYGALRLLALSFNCVLQNMNDELIVDTVAGARETLEAKPRLHLTDDQILHGQVQFGTPVRRRNEDF